MAEKSPITVYSFTNATLVGWGYGALKDPNFVALDLGFPMEPVKGFSEDTVKRFAEKNYGLYGPISGDFSLVKSNWSQELVSYVPKDQSAGLRSLDAADFDRLTDSFKSHYRKGLTEPVETKVELDFDLQRFDYELLEEVLMSDSKSYLTDLHGVIFPVRERNRERSNYGWSSSREPRLDIARALPVELSSDEIFVLINHFGTRFERKREVGYRTRVVHSSPYAEAPSLKLTFLAAPYDGATRKLLSTKKGGGYYKDLRGRLVDDFPREVGTATVTQSDILSWWNAIDGPSLSDDGKYRAVEALTRRFWGL